MDREPGILEQRVEVAPLDRRLGDAGERVRGREDEDQERVRDRALDRERVGAQAIGHAGAGERHHGAEQRQDQHPQEHRALVVPPHAGKLVDERLLRVRVLDDVEHREVGGHVGARQRRERESDEREHRERRRAGDSHEDRIAGAGAPERDDELDERQPECEREREMTGLDQHGGSP
jgi:hypothetical protein